MAYFERRTAVEGDYELDGIAGRTHADSDVPSGKLAQCLAAAARQVAGYCSHCGMLSRAETVAE
jgi:hypothetical protein